MSDAVARLVATAVEIASETDRAEASYADHLYLIISLAVDPPDVALFRLDDGGRGNFLRLPFVTVR